MSTPRCGSTETESGEPCRQPVSEEGERCWRHPDSVAVPDEDPHGLTDKQRRFVEEYTGPANFNASEAARRAGYSEKTAGQIGYQLLQKPSIEEAVEDRLDRLAMTADEALKRLADWARGDIGQLIEVKEDGRWSLDLEKAREQGKLHLIKELSYDRDGRPKVKMYDAKDAVKQIARAHGLFVDRTEITGRDGGPIESVDRTAEQMEEKLRELLEAGEIDEGDLRTLQRAGDLLPAVASNGHQG